MFFRIAGIVLVQAFVATVATDEVWTGLTSSWSLDTSTMFYDLPQTLEAAVIEGWTSIEGVNPAEGITALGYEGDPTLVLLFQNGTVIGVQFAFLVEGVNARQPLVWDECGSVIRKTLNGELYYTATAYFYSDGSVRKIWFQEKDRLVEIPTTASRVVSETPLAKKNCYPTMGTHYYAWFENSDCASLYPWLVLANEDDIIGIAFQGFGKPNQIGSRVWWEYVPAIGIYTAIPDPPQCAVDAMSEYQALSIHVWFVKDPKNITCS